MPDGTDPTGVDLLLLVTAFRANLSGQILDASWQASSNKVEIQQLRDLIAELSGSSTDAGQNIQMETIRQALIALVQPLF